jgi:hypothetical protein
VGAASNRSRLAGIRTDFDSLPIMGSLMRSIARNQHDDHYDEATREVNDKIVSRACHEIDAATEPRFRDLAERVRTKVWEPMVRLGLEPTTVGLETTADTAVARVRLAGARQLAAHTPRPRAPADALLSVQVHESSVNNACECFDFGGRRLTVAEVVRTVCDRLALPTRIPDDLPADVEVAFAAEEPLRVECRDGLVHVRLALDAIESDRRAWYDIVAQVASSARGRCGSRAPASRDAWNWRCARSSASSSPRSGPCHCCRSDSWATSGSPTCGPCRR